MADANKAIAKRLKSKGKRNPWASKGDDITAPQTNNFFSFFRLLGLQR